MEEEQEIPRITQNSLNKHMLPTNWRPSKKYRQMSIQEANKIRAQHKILAEGEDLMAPITSFKDMRLPQEFLDILEEKGITQTKGIQAQCLPAVFSGRDVIGISPSGSGKSLIFSIQALILAFEEEKTMPIVRGEGPLCLIITPSHELAVQTYDNLQYFIEKLNRKDYPLLKAVLCIGGVDMGRQIDALKKGAHIVIGTPGRLSDLLKKNRFNLDLCEFLVLDEADRLLDAAFESELAHLLGSIQSRKQAILISSTLSQKIQDFSKTLLKNPIAVSAGSNVTTSLNVIQEVDYVRTEDKLPHLLDSLNKTSPPVIIFCENKADVDAIHEYLLTRGVDTAGLHGGKSQDERSQAIHDFRKGKKDVLVATDVAAKGLEFPDVKHVINYNLPRDINNYVNRITRVGRINATGLATTFINKGCDQGALLELKDILIQCGQSVPPFLKVIEDKDAQKLVCNYCGSNKHKLKHCLKLERKKLKELAGTDFDEEK